MATLDSLGLAASSFDEPLAYPGRLPASSFLLIDDRLLPLAGTDERPTVDSGADPVCAARLAGADSLDGALASLAATPMGSRTPVVAVGSNAAPAQLRTKLLGHGAQPVVPAQRVRITGLEVGHSAHVSRGGYVPAAPFASRGARAELFVLWLDGAQRNAVDATEPGYRRQRLPEGCTVTLPCGRGLAGAEVYRSRHGLLSLDGSAPLPLRSQREVVGGLRERLDAEGPPRWPSVEAFVRACTGSATLRGWVSARLGELGLVVPDHLAGQG